MFLNKLIIITAALTHLKSSGQNVNKMLIPSKFSCFHNCQKLKLKSWLELNYLHSPQIKNTRPYECYGNRLYSFFLSGR